MRKSEKIGVFELVIAEWKVQCWVVRNKRSETLIQVLQESFKSAESTWLFYTKPSSSNANG